MINIKLDVENMWVQIVGHAESAPKGEDMVCAAVSTLAYTLAYNLQMMLDKSEYTIHMEEGDAAIAALPNGYQAEQCREIFRVIGNGLCMLAGQYDQYIHFEGN